MPSKYEREIEEILERSRWEPNRLATLPVSVRRRISLFSPGVLVGLFARRASSTILIGVSVALALLVVLLPGQVSQLRLPLVLTSLACFVLALIVGAISRRASRRHNWRGRDLDDRPPSLDEWLRRLRGKDRGDYR